MSFRTASAILRSGWLIQKDFVYANTDMILDLRRNKEVSFGMTEREEEDLKKALNQVGVSMASSTRYYQVGMYTDFNMVQDGSIAVINLLGPVLKYGDMCSYGMVDKADLIQRVAVSGKFKSIVMNVDSPGGQADGTQLLADTIRQVREMFGMMVVAVVNDGMMASAAMWIGAACDYIYATKLTDSFGSIGVYMTIIDFREYLKAQGISMRSIYADPSTDKNKGYNDALDGDDTLLKEDLNFLAEAFFSAVREFRGDRLNTAEENPFTGKMYPAQKAMEIGLIDGILPFDNVLAVADGQLDPLTQTPNSSINMFGNKFSALTALAGVAAASITASQVEAVNKQIAEQKIEGVTLALDSELETASIAAVANAAALNAINAALGEGNHKETLADAVVALVKAKQDGDKSLSTANADVAKYKGLAEQYGAKADDEPTGGAKTDAEEQPKQADQAKPGAIYSEADEELKRMKAGMQVLPKK